MTLSAARPEPVRDFMRGPVNARREVVWYESYAPRMRKPLRRTLRRALDQASRSTSGNMTIRFLPDPDDTTAMLKARASIAAAWQDKLWDVHDALTREPEMTREKAQHLAEAAGLDIDAFTADLSSQRTEDRLAEDRRLAEAEGFDRGPLLFIDHRAYDGVFDEESLVEALEKPLGLRLKKASAAFSEWAAAGGLVLILATLAALAVANFGLFGLYDHLRHSVLAVSWNDARFGLTVEHWINDGLMTLFFLIVGIEIKREVVAGELSDPRSAALPIVAAIGGMAVPAAIYFWINAGTPTAGGWGVPMATDIAFTLGLLAILGPRVPASLRVFVSALAIADDLGAIIVIALFYSEGISLEPLIWAAGILAVMLVLGRVRVYALWPYLALGVLLWVAIHAGGLHATLAGVLTAFAIPSRRPADVHGIAAQTETIMRREADRGAPEEGFAAHTVERLSEIVRRLREPGMHLQKGLESWTNFLILPLFAFFNTGLVLSAGFDWTSPPSLGVILGLAVGKPLGICVATWLVLTSGLARRADDITWRHLIGASCLAGIGFTMSIFIAGAAFEGPALDAVKIAVLVASTLSAVVGMAILWVKSPDKRGNTA